MKEGGKFDLPLFLCHNIWRWRDNAMNQERIRLIIRNIELLMNQLQLEIDEDDEVSIPLAESSLLMLKSIELNLRVINERKELNKVY